MPVPGRFFPGWSILALVLAQACRIDAGTAQHPMSYTDIVAFRKPQLVSLSPDGRTIAYTVREGRLADNRSVDIVYMVDAAGGPPRMGPACDKAQGLSWDARGRLYLLATQDTGAMIARLDSAAHAEVVVSSASAINTFAVSPDGRSIYYSTTRKTPPAEVQRRKEEGYVYNWDTDNSRTIINRRYEQNEWEDVWESIGSSPTRLLLSEPCNGLDTLSVLQALVVSPDGRRLALVVLLPGSPRKGGTPYRSGLLVRDLVTGETWSPFADSIESERTPCWTGDHELVCSRGYPTSTLWRCDVTAKTVAPLGWVKLPGLGMVAALSWDGANRQLQAFSDRGLNRLSLDQGTTGELEPVRVVLGQTPALDARATKLATISESITEPPEIALYDLAGKTTSRLTQLNPQLKDLALGTVERIRVEAAPGVAVSGYLLHPVGEEPGRKYPLIIATYGFTGKFTTDAEWHSTFPAQTLAGQGYVVLMLNIPGTAQGLAGNPVKARQIEGWNKLAVFEKALDQLLARGLVDPAKVGLYGWSMGCFTVEFLVAHSKRFQVACVGEGGDYNPGMFWAYGSEIQAQIFDNIFGGPPWGATLKNYEEFSPFYHVDQISTPLLMEFVGGLPFGLEMYVPLRYRRVPAELVLYEGEEHNFVKPRARVASMARKVDWFNFWLLGREDSDPQKAEQYSRWRTLRELRNADLKRNRVGPTATDAAR